VAYRFIDEHREEFGLRWLLIHLGICPNAYYNYLKHLKDEYCANKRKVCDVIKSLYHEHNGVYGHRYMKVFLARRNIVLSKTTIHKYMNKELHLHAITRKRKPGYQKGHAHQIFPNLLDRKFHVDEPNRVWCTDFTYLFLTNGDMRFNCTIIDLYDRSVVASENGKFITSGLAIQALEKALTAKDCNPGKLVLHSDQGSQFTSAEFILYCQKRGIAQSMSHAGCPYDNAPMERYYNTLKAELIYQYNFRSDAELNHAVSEFAYLWYNQLRPHSYNDYKTPFEKRFGLG
jgi:putative transposase